VKDGGPPSGGGRSAAARRDRPASRRLSRAARLRGHLRGLANRVLGMDRLWSVAFVTVIVALLAGQRFGRGFETLRVGEMVPYDIQATYDIDVVDAALTEERRRQARERIPQVYVHDTERGWNLAGDLATLFEDGRRVLQEAQLSSDSGPRRATLEALQGRAPEPTLAILIRRGFDERHEHPLTAALSGVMRAPIVVNRSVLQREPAVLLVRLPGQRAEKVSRYDAFIEVEQARDEVRRRATAGLDLPAAEETRLSELAASFVDANVHFDSEATERRREEAAQAVPPVLVRVGSGDVLVKKGERVTREILAKLHAARRSAAQKLNLPYLLGLLLIVSLLAFFVYRYTRYQQRGFRQIEHLYALFVLMLLSMLVFSRALLWLARKLVDGLGEPFSQLGTYTYLVPLGAGAILIALLADGRIAIVYSCFASLLFGALNDWDPYLMLWAMLVHCAGVFAISAYRERAALLRAGLVVGGVSAASVIALRALEGSLEPLARSLYATVLAFAGGAVGVGLLVSFSLPLLERMFNVLTDIRLLELSNLNTPLLSQLAVKAPGSYNHSLVVGTLAEEAAKAIGANSLFCRVAAFYHDVGKMKKPEYYVENQRAGNPHDRLSPSMSALIIAAHVKDGITLAREAGIPQQIIDIIPQHHGTRLMTYFYERARQHADPGLGPIQEDDFRYPGPKPQTREAAIFMLADAVEAAARTVDDPSPNRLREMMRQVFNSVVLERQLDACDLSFAELEKIQDAFLRLLVSMYHHRVDYPGFDFNPRRGEVKPARETRQRPIARGS
jgi:putative nucleotidyltransferase with HDIG domain